MKEIREIFETVRTYCGMIFGDAKLDAKSVTGVTESLLAPMAGEESSSLRTVVSIRNAGAGENQKETIQSNLSLEFLNSLPFIKKFYPVLNLLVTSLALYEYAPAFTLCSLVLHAPRVQQKRHGRSLLHLLAIRTRCTPSVRKFAALHWGEGKVTKVAHDNNFNSPETDHAFGIIASKLVSLSDWQIRPTATHHSLKKAAFTLAEVLITLGIIGVVAALTLPTLIQNHQKQVYVTQLKKAYSNISNALSQVVNDEGVVDWDQACIVTTIYDYHEKTNINACLHKVAKQMKALNIKDYGVTCSADWCKYGYDVDNDINTQTTLANEATGMFTTPDGMLYMFPCWALTNVVVDVNGISKSPNKPGRDIFEFYNAGEYKQDSNGNWIYEFKNALSPYGSGSSNGCSATNLSTSCTAKVLIEGKMNY